MGKVVDFQAWRLRRQGQPTQPVLIDPGPDQAVSEERPAEVTRLDLAVRRIERAMASGHRRISARVETELLAITGAVSAGRTDEAATRAERLAERLEHPSSRLSG
ncbi:MAG TPA: hypothetical protein VF971_10470 [Candidatus Limnocylindrales bacterium]|jgi:hypothetical protein